MKNPQNLDVNMLFSAVAGKRKLSAKTKAGVRVITKWSIKPEYGEQKNVKRLPLMLFNFFWALDKFREWDLLAVMLSTRK